MNHVSAPEEIFIRIHELVAENFRVFQYPLEILSSEYISIVSKCCQFPLLTSGGWFWSITFHNNQTTSGCGGFHDGHCAGLFYLHDQDATWKQTAYILQCLSGMCSYFCVKRPFASQCRFHRSFRECLCRQHSIRWYNILSSTGG